MLSSRKLTQVTTRLAGTLVLLVALAAPISYFALSYQYHAARIQTEAGFYAASVSRFINTEPDWWQFQIQQLAVLIMGYGDDEELKLRAILDLNGETIVQSSDQVLSNLVISRSSPLFDSGNIVGHLKVTRSIKPLIPGTIVAGLIGLFIGGMIYLVLIVFPLRALKEALQTLADEKERAEVTLDSIGEAVITTDNNGYVDYLNPIARTLTGWKRKSAYGLTAAEVLRFSDEDSNNSLASPVDEVLAGKSTQAPSGRATMISANGQPIAIEYVAKPIRSSVGEVSGVVLTFRDVTKTNKLEKKLSHQATHDELTGLINRRAFQQELHHAINSARQDNHHHVLCFMDLDQFKIVNDTSGHGAGDELLRLLALELKAALRSEDVLARLGGDEFGLLLKGCPIEKGEEIAQTLLQTIRNFRFHWQNHVFSVGVSIGIVGIDAKCSGLVEIMSIADAACYAAKDSGRNRTYVYRRNDSEMSQRRGEMRWVSRITRAIDESRLRLYYQTILSLNATSSKTTGKHFEILVRMIDEDGKMILPNHFIPAAESYGVMPSIDRWVIAHTFATLAPRYHDKWKRLPDTCCINLSGTSWGDEMLAGYICEMAARYRIPPRVICFELTETAAINNLDKTRKFINELKEIGFRFSLDDFGSGVNSFSHLKRLPVDYLKIDGSFVTHIIDDKIDYAMVEAINHVGHVMGIETIAEFVENDEILQVIRAIGIDKAQGYGISKPIPFSLATLESTSVDPSPEDDSDESIPIRIARLKAKNDY